MTLYGVHFILLLTFFFNSLDKAFLHLVSLLNEDSPGKRGEWALPLAELLLCAEALDLMHIISFNPKDPERWVFSFHACCFERGSGWPKDCRVTSERNDLIPALPESPIYVLLTCMPLLLILAFFQIK